MVLQLERLRELEVVKETHQLQLDAALVVLQVGLQVLQYFVLWKELTGKYLQKIWPVIRFFLDHFLDEGDCVFRHAPSQAWQDLLFLDRIVYLVEFLEAYVVVAEHIQEHHT